MPAPIRANVRRMMPYSPGKPIEEVKRELGLDRVVKLASNENPLGPSPMAIAAIREAATNLHVYPDGAAHSLRQAIAAKFAVPMDLVMVGNGSDELIHLLGLVFLAGEDDEIIVGDPSFVRYDAAAHLAPAKLVKVPLDADYRHDLTAMRQAVTERTRLLFVANPNNPTGTLVRRREVDALLADLPPHVTLVLDEAYFEFAADLPEYPVSLDYVREGKPVIGLRTFSKAYGLAGVRLGFGFASAEVVDAYQRAREPFNVNSLAQVAGIAALADDAHVRETVALNRRGLDRMREAFLAVGARPVESFANFVLADLGRPARPVFEALLARGIITRSGDVLGAPTCLRVSIGTEEEIEMFVKAFHEVMQPAVPA